MLKNNNSRAKNAMISMVIIVLLSLITGIFYFLEYILISSDDILGNLEAIESSDTRIQFISIASLIISIPVAITFIQWFRRAYYNLHQLKLKPESTEGWAAGSWFIPAYNLIKPFQIMKEIWDLTFSFLSGRYTIQEDILKTKNLLGIWWLFYIGPNIIEIVAGQFRKTQDLDNFVISSILMIVANIGSVIGAVLCIKVISQYNKLERILPTIEDDPFADFGKNDLDKNWEDQPSPNNEDRNLL